MFGIVLALALTLLARGTGHANVYVPAETEAAGAGLLMGVITMLIWNHKGGTKLVGFLWGFFLSLIGLVVVLVATPSAAKQPKP